VLLRDPLIRTALERREIASVAPRHQIGDVLAVVIPRARDGRDRAHHVDRKRRRMRRREPLIDEHLGVNRMIDDK
jgi:hypothetical protein